MKQNKKQKEKKIQKRERAVERMKNSIVIFLWCDDKTKVKASKKSTKTCKKDKRQKRLLSDSLNGLSIRKCKTYGIR